jgi:hypothetical protein
LGKTPPFGITLTVESIEVNERRVAGPGHGDLKIDNFAKEKKLCGRGAANPDK